MEKGATTREHILAQSAELASLTGLQGLSIGNLAAHTGLSKSGLFRHFGSKEQLQLDTLRAAVERFTATVVRPALQTPRGIARVRRLFDGWLEWEGDRGLPGGCLFIAASIELDDQPGPVRDYLVQTQQEWLDFIAVTARKAVDTGDFRADLDCEQFAHEMNALFLGFHHASRLLGDPRAGDRVRTAFGRLLDDACRQPH